MAFQQALIYHLEGNVTLVYRMNNILPEVDGTIFKSQDGLHIETSIAGSLIGINHDY